MAIDTQEKRMAAAGAGRPWMRGKLPGTNDQEWRIASGNAYGGNTIAETITTRVEAPTEFPRSSEAIDPHVYPRQQAVVDAT